MHEPSSAATTPNNLLPISRKSILHDSANFNNPLKPFITQLEDNEIFHLPQPVFGEHNKENDALLVFAYGYRPPSILRFTESLVHTGYDGDIVLGVDYARLIKSLEKEGEGGKGKSSNYSDNNAAIALERYLEQRAEDNNLVVYDVRLDCEPDNPTLCTAPYMYQKTNHSRDEYEFLPDPRIARSVKLLRYEYYWAWSTNYIDAPSGRIFVSDLRDVYFQQNAFVAPFFASG